MKLPILLSALTAATLVSAYDASACNNSPSLCDKPYDDVTYLGAHNSPSLRNAQTDFNIGGVQYFNVTVQLSAGVRLVTAQLQLKDGKPRLCHGSCSFIDSGTLDDYFKEIRAWLDKNPSEVITITLINEPRVSPTDLTASFASANLASELYTPTGTGEWPTLRELIDAKTRLIVYLTDGHNTATHPSLLPQFDYTFETAYENYSELDFTKCAPDRPAGLSAADAVASGRLPWANRYLYSEGLVQLPNVGRINETNNPDNLYASLTQCADAWGGIPSYVLVDFFNEGPAIGAIDRLNGVTKAVNRVEPPKSPKRGEDGGEVGDVDVTNGGSVGERKALAVKALMGEDVPVADWILVAGGWGKMIKL
ncbi:PLC-like phosphodiesterase [Ascobolus immersus RN42]|uniref:PLC-like phosphodiesterase n=1 Tax=Ascobolus immersus RN42 TaxID=1160509 RepID=A0A3N4HGP7_ASCIM|nr:PLC-like phosphodiesterase [Ascobolus immersus RN42]